MEEFSDSDEPPSSSTETSEFFSPPVLPSFILKDKLPSRNSLSSPKTTIFRKSHYPDISREQWNDWRWQLQNRIRKTDELSLIIRLSENEKEALEHSNGMLPLSITPYYASLIDRDDASHPLRRCVIPVSTELIRTEGESDDPLHEEGDSPVPGLVHRYPDRVLFLATDFCSTYCRYCTRSRMVGRSCSNIMSTKRWEMALGYIESHTEVRDVLISGGDPLTLSDESLEWLLSSLRSIQHVEIVRIGTKVPVVLPQRITSNLVNMLKKYHPLWMNIHFTHPDEITPETENALNKLANAGIPLGSQTVLLKGINDNLDTMKKLYHKLLMARVRPYYLYQCDPISGSSHFRTPVEKGLEIIKGLRGHTTGFAVPNYVIDAPGGGGKIPLQPGYYQGHNGTSVILKNYEDKLFTYPDTCPAE
ncbi:MAG: KamA family radical SAM protein [Spirochaetes bacterium]|nr:KamA family radical SAM protein [Spirochaetota bacterium]